MKLGTKAWIDYHSSYYSQNENKAIYIYIYILYKEGIPKDKQGNITHNDSNTLCLFVTWIILASFITAES